MAPVLSFLTLGFLLAGLVSAHPGHDVKQEAAERVEFMKRAPKSVRSCASNLRRRGHLDSTMERRKKLAQDIRQKRGLESKRPVRRDFATYNVSHASTLDVEYGSDETALFSDNSSCVLQPEVTQGPYYVDGELIRSDVTEEQAGVYLYLDIQFVDTSTCAPVPAMFIDFWHCNATGVYSGVNAAGNGDSDDTTNTNQTFLRGLQQTDKNGVAQFESVVPGHYSGRTTHVHILAHRANETIIRTNSTILGSNGTTHAAHVGQLFFDQDLLSQVAKVSPYSTNTQSLTLNSEDDILLSETDNMDPFVEYVLLGDDVSDGVLAWISIGIDPNADNAVSSAATIYESGGVANSNSNFGGPGGSGGGPNGTAPGGSRPSGSPPSGAARSGTASSSAVAA